MSIIVDYQCTQCGEQQPVIELTDDFYDDSRRVCEQCGGWMVSVDRIEWERREFQDLLSQEER